MVFRNKNISSIIKETFELAEIYSLTTGVNCIAYNISDGSIIAKNLNSRSSFCELVQKFDHKNCEQLYIYSGLQSEKYDEPYISFCPYGLINWTVPIVNKGQIKIFLTAGAILIHEVDEILLENIFELSPPLRLKKEEVKSKLEELPVLDTVKVKYLANLLHYLVNSFEIENMFKNKMSKNILYNLAADIRGIYSIQKEKELLTCLKLGDRKRVEELAMEILELSYSQREIESVKIAAINLVVVCVQTAAEIGTNFDDILEYQIIEEIINVEQFDRITYAVLEILKQIMKTAFVKSAHENEGLIFKAMEYIRENYADISLEDVASKVSLTPNYFSKFFKKETGMTFIEFLNKVRVEESKEWLQKGLPLVEISRKIGFKNQSYFSKIFKKYEGVSPSNWKRG